MQEWRRGRGYVAGDDEWNDLQVRLSTVADTAATATDPDTGKQEPVRKKGVNTKHLAATVRP